MRPRKPNLNRFTCKRCKLVLHHNKCLPHFRLVQSFSQCCMREPGKRLVSDLDPYLLQISDL